MVSSVDLHNTVRLHWSFLFQYTVTGATSNKWSPVTIRIGKFAIQALIDQAYTSTFFFTVGYLFHYNYMYKFVNSFVHIFKKSSRF